MSSSLVFSSLVSSLVFPQVFSPTSCALLCVLAVIPLAVAGICIRLPLPQQTCPSWAPGLITTMPHYSLSGQVPRGAPERSERGLDGAMAGPRPYLRLVQCGGQLPGTAPH